MGHKVPAPPPPAQGSGYVSGRTVFKDPATGDLTDVHGIPIIGQSVAGTTIVTGNSNIVISDDGRVAKKETALKEIPTRTILSEDQAFERIGASARLSLKQVELSQEKAREESGQFFRFTITFSALGFGVVLAAVVLLLYGQVAAGAVSTIASIIPAAVAAIFSKKDAELRRVVHKYHSYMLDLQKVLTMIDVAETIRDTAERDRIKTEIIYRVLPVQESTNATN